MEKKEYVKGLVFASECLSHYGRQDSAYILLKAAAIQDKSDNLLQRAFEPALQRSDWFLASTCVSALVQATETQQHTELKTWALHARGRLRKALRTSLEKDAPPFKVAFSILDEISEVNWSKEFKLQPLMKETVDDQLEGTKVDFSFLESAWKGNGNNWEYAFTSPNLQHANAKNLVKTLGKLRDKPDVPLAIWNKEDPLHFDKFLPIMKYAEHIFTTDERMVPKYEANTNAKTVTVLPFGADLKLCNPIGRYREKEETVCFAGSYYSEGHDERNRQMKFILEPISTFSGAIYDRMSKLENPRYHFPEKFRPFIRDAVGFEQILKVYRQFKVFMNVNTIIDSKTMMSRRVYELLASGTPVVSAPSRALEEQFSGIVQMPTDAKSANAAVGKLLSDDIYWRKVSQLGIREVASNHQYRHRAAIIRNTLFGEKIPDDEKQATIVMSTKRPEYLERIVTNITRQKSVRMEVIFALTDVWPEATMSELYNRISAAPNVVSCRIIKFEPQVSLGRKLDIAIQSGQSKYVAKFDDDDFYFENYLQDMLMCFDFCEYDIVGKWTFPVWLEGSDKLYLRNRGREHCPWQFVAGATLVMKREWYQKIRFSDRTQGEDSDFLRRSHAAGARIYSADYFNFINYRSKDQSHHTWGAEDELFQRTGGLVGGRENFSDWVV